MTKYVLSKLGKRKTIPLTSISDTVQSRTRILEYTEYEIDLDEELIDEVFEICEDGLEGYIGDGFYSIPVDTLLEVCQNAIDEGDRSLEKIKALEYPKTVLYNYIGFLLEPYEELEDLE